MKFVDFGDCAVISVEDIRWLPTRFQQLPCLAVHVRLRGLCALKFADLIFIYLFIYLFNKPH